MADGPKQRFPQRPLTDALRDVGGSAAPEDLFQIAGYDRNSTQDIEAFYLVLRDHLTEKTIVSSGRLGGSPVLEVSNDAPR